MTLLHQRRAAQAFLHRTVNFILCVTAITFTSTVNAASISAETRICFGYTGSVDRPVLSCSPGTSGGNGGVIIGGSGVGSGINVPFQSDGFGTELSASAGALQDYGIFAATRTTTGLSSTGTFSAACMPPTLSAVLRIPGPSLEVPGRQTPVDLHRDWGRDCGSIYCWRKRLGIGGRQSGNRRKPGFRIWRGPVSEYGWHLSVVHRWSRRHAVYFWRPVQAQCEPRRLRWRKL